MKKLLTLFIMTLILFTSSGCHGSVDSSSFVVPENFDETKDYEITFWAKNDTNINQVKVYEKAIEDFEELYPNIKVKIKLYTDYSRIYNDVITNISTNTTPNICITYPDHIATYKTSNNTVVELDSLMDDEKYGLGGKEVKFDSVSKDEVVSYFLNEGIIDDQYYCLPFMRSTEALYINKTMVESLGYEIPEIVSWDFIFEVSDKAMEKDESGKFIINGQDVLIPFIYKSTDNMMIQMLRQLDAPYSDSNGNIELFSEYTTNILKEIAIHAKNKSFSTFKISSYPGNFLNAGQCIFAIDSTAGSTWMGSDAPLLDIPKDQLVDFEMVVKPIPQYNKENIKMISQGPSICIFNKQDPNEVLASWLFAQYLLTNDVQLGYSKTEGYVPVTLKAQSSDEYKDYLSFVGSDNNEHYFAKIEASNILRENMNNTFTTPVFNGSASLRSASGELIESVCKDTKKNKTIDDNYFKTLYENINSLYKLDQQNSLSLNEDLGPLPQASKTLLSVLALIWVLIGVNYLISLKKR